MRKNIFYAASLAFIAFGMSSCGNSAKPTEETAKTITYQLDPSTSLKWKGTYAGDGHTHNGTVKVSKGTITYKGDAFESGKFTVDMKTIENELTPDAGRDDLNSSIMGEGLFNAAQFPNVDVIVNSISEKEMDATLKVAGKEVPAKMPLSINKSDKTFTAKGTFTVDFSPMEAEGFKPGTEKGKEMQYIKPGVAFELNLIMKAK